MDSNPLTGGPQWSGDSWQCTVGNVMMHADWLIGRWLPTFVGLVIHVVLITI